MRLDRNLLLLGDFFAKCDLLKSVLELRMEALVRLFLLLDRLLKCIILSLTLPFDVSLKDFIAYLELIDFRLKVLNFLIGIVLTLTEPTVGQGLLEEGLVTLN